LRLYLATEIDEFEAVAHASEDSDLVPLGEERNETVADEQAVGGDDDRYRGPRDRLPGVVLAPIPCPWAGLGQERHRSDDVAVFGLDGTAGRPYGDGVPVRSAAIELSWPPGRLGDQLLDLVTSGRVLKVVGEVMTDYFVGLPPEQSGGGAVPV
jgi:hypothetical protein